MDWQPINAEALKRVLDRLLLAMEAQCADWSEAQPAIFTKCTEAYHGRRHITMNYADYFFISNKKTAASRIGESAVFPI